MALSFNGTSSNLSRAGGLVSAYPFTMFAWVRPVSTQAAFALELAIDPSSRGTHEGHGMVSTWGSMLAWSTIGSGVAAYSASGVQVGTWVPCMVVFSSNSLRKVYYGSGAVRTENTPVAQVPSTLNLFSIGKQAAKSSGFWNGDLACVGIWASELTATDFATLAGGVVPSTVQSSTLIDYWSLATQGATQTSINGRMLAASNTSQAATHPIVENVAADTTPPTLAGSITVSNVTGTSYSLAWPAGSDNVAVTSYERSLDAGASWVDVGSARTLDVTGRTPATTDQVRVRAKDAAGNVSTALATSVTLPDTIAPTLSGSISVSAITSSSYTLAWPAGADNVGIAAYEVSVDGGSSYASVGSQLSASISGRTPSSTDQVRVRARDAAGNVSAPLSTTVSLLGGVDSTPPTMVGSIAVSGLTTTSYLLAWSAATDNVGVTAYEVSVDGGSTYTSVGNLLGCYIGSRTPGATDQVRLRARDAAGNLSLPLSTTVTLLGTTDTTPPTLTGSISANGITSTGYTLTWGAASDNVGVTAYEYSLDGGSTWASNGNQLTTTISGRTPGTTDQVRVRARDAAGNVSSPPLSSSVTLATVGLPTLTTPPMKNNTGTLLANLNGITVNVYSSTTGALVVQKTGLTSNSAGVVTISDAALVSGTTYAYEVVTLAHGRRLPTGVCA